MLVEAPRGVQSHSTISHVESVASALSQLPSCSVTCRIDEAQLARHENGRMTMDVDESMDGSSSSIADHVAAVRMWEI